MDCDIILFVPSNIGSKRKAPIAQLDRAFDYESKGHRFESCWVHHEKPLTSFAPLRVFLLRFEKLRWKLFNRICNMKRNFRNPPKVQLFGGFHADSETSFTYKNRKCRLASFSLLQPPLEFHPSACYSKAYQAALFTFKGEFA